MKTKLFISLVLSVALMSVTTWTKAQTFQLHTNGLNAGNTYDTAVCQSLFNIVRLHKANWQINNIRIEKTGTGFWNVDSMDIAPADEGTWKIKSDEGNFIINIWFVSPPMTPFTTPTTNLCGSYNAQNNAEPLTKYLWSTTQTTQSIDIITPGTYNVTVSSGAQGCGFITGSIDVLWSEPTPSLLIGGPFCFGIDTLQLDPSYTHQYSGYLWSNGATTRWISASSSGTYGVTVTSAGGCKMSTNTNLIFNLPTHMRMCDVSFDTLTGKNMITWFVDPMSDIDSVRIYKKNQWGIFILLTTVAYSQGNFIDWGSLPQGNSYEYYIQAVSNCGPATPSGIHRSLRLTTTQFNNEVTNWWENYYGENGNDTVLSYIVCAKYYSGVITFLDTVPYCAGQGCQNQSSSIYDPTIEKYFIIFQKLCLSNKSLSGNWAFSNYQVPTIITEVENLMLESTISIFPNPTNDGICTIDGTKGPFIVEVYDILGRKVFRQENQKTINITGSPGLYLVNICTNKGVSSFKIQKR